MTKPGPKGPRIKGGRMRPDERMIAQWLRAIDEPDLADAIEDGEPRRFRARKQARKCADVELDVVDMLEGGCV